MHPYPEVEKAVIEFARKGSENPHPPSPPEIILLINEARAKKRAEIRNKQLIEHQPEPTNHKPYVDEETKWKLEQLLGKTTEKCRL